MAIVENTNIEDISIGMFLHYIDPVLNALVAIEIFSKELLNQNVNFCKYIDHLERQKAIAFSNNCVSYSFFSRLFEKWVDLFSRFLYFWLQTGLVPECFKSMLIVRREMEHLYGTELVFIDESPNFMSSKVSELKFLAQTVDKLPRCRGTKIHAQTEAVNALQLVTAMYDEASLQINQQFTQNAKYMESLR
jgi:hypothetical protein